MKTAFSFLLSLILFTVIHAQDREWQTFVYESAFSQYALSDQEQAEPSVIVSSQAKSLKKALFMSAVLPGAGQYYSGSLIKTGIFLVIEAAGWTYFVSQKSEGNDIRDEFRIYADKHWIEDDYWEWIANKSGIDKSDMDALREWETANYSHHLHIDKDQQYYEMIGKYDQFNYGWDDSEIAIGDEGWDKSKRSTNRLYYETRRDAHNAALKNASTGLTVVLFNHIFSAIDAAWSVSRHNKKLAQLELKMLPKQLNETRYAALNLQVNW